MIAVSLPKEVAPEPGLKVSTTYQFLAISCARQSSGGGRSDQWRTEMNDFETNELPVA